MTHRPSTPMAATASVPDALRAMSWKPSSPAWGIFVTSSPRSTGSLETAVSMTCSRARPLARSRPPTTVMLEVAAMTLPSNGWENSVTPA